jgi:hypothetical protein
MELTNAKIDAIENLVDKYFPKDQDNERVKAVSLITDVYLVLKNKDPKVERADELLRMENMGFTDYWRD